MTGDKRVKLGRKTMPSPGEIPPYSTYGRCVICGEYALADTGANVCIECVRAIPWVQERLHETWQLEYVNSKLAPFATFVCGFCDINFQVDDDKLYANNRIQCPQCHRPAVSLLEANEGAHKMRIRELERELERVKEVVRAFAEMPVHYDEDERFVVETAVAALRQLAHTIINVQNVWSKTFVHDRLMELAGSLNKITGS